MKTTAECWKSLILDGEKLVYGPSSSSIDLDIIHWDNTKNILVDEGGNEVSHIKFNYPSDWRIYKEPPKAWEPPKDWKHILLENGYIDELLFSNDYHDIGATRPSREQAEHEAKTRLIPANRLGAWVAGQSPYFRPVWGRKYPFVYFRLLDRRWSWAYGYFCRPGTVPMPTENIVIRCCEMLNSGELKLSD